MKINPSNQLILDKISAKYKYAYFDNSNVDFILIKIDNYPIPFEVIIKGIPNEAGYLNYFHITIYSNFFNFTEILYTKPSPPYNQNFKTIEEVFNEIDTYFLNLINQITELISLPNND